MKWTPAPPCLPLAASYRGAACEARDGSVGANSRSAAGPRSQKATRYAHLEMRHATGVSTRLAAVTFLPDSQLHCFLSPPETDPKKSEALGPGLFSAPKPFGDPDSIPQTCIGNYN